MDGKSIREEIKEIVEDNYCIITGRNYGIGEVEVINRTFRT